MNISSRLRFSVFLLGLTPVFITLAMLLFCPEFTKMGAVTTVLAVGSILSILVTFFILFNLRRYLTMPLENIRAYAVSIQKGKKNDNWSGEFEYELLELKDAVCSMVKGLEDANEKTKQLSHEAALKAGESEAALKAVVKRKSRLHDFSIQCTRLLTRLRILLYEFFPILMNLPSA